MGRYNNYEGKSRRYRGEHFRHEEERAASPIVEEKVVEKVEDDTVKKPEAKPVTKNQNDKKFVKVAIGNLNIRKGPGKNFDRTGKFTGIGTFEISETKMGEGAEKGWGRLASGEGWISLDFCEELK